MAAEKCRATVRPSSAGHWWSATPAKKVDVRVDGVDVQRAPRQLVHQWRLAPAVAVGAWGGR
eukprot:5753626-Pleurochrysis_carterae.AAC.1